MRCQICNLTISQFNDIDRLTAAPINDEALDYGFSVLHSYIRFMEAVLHVSYREKMAIECGIRNPQNNKPKWGVCIFTSIEIFL